jgi:hypothetical protein
VNIPDVKSMAFPSFTTAELKGIIPHVKNEEFRWADLTFLRRLCI